jgi:hypothetical protein
MAPNKRKSGGRKAGTPNRATAPIRLALQQLAESYSCDALRVLRAVMRDKKAPFIARVLAADKILDRAVGKAPQAITGDAGGPVQVQTTIVHQHELTR